MPYRFRIISEIKYGHLGDYMATWKQLYSIMRERGWNAARLLVPTAGPNNEVVAEFEYPDLATFERENKAFYTDEAAFAAFRAGAEFVVQGTSRARSYTKTSRWTCSAATEVRNDVHQGAAEVAGSRGAKRSLEPKYGSFGRRPAIRTAEPRLVGPS
jgi:hypothetical protein